MTQEGSNCRYRLKAATGPFEHLTDIICHRGQCKCDISVTCYLPKPDIDEWERVIYREGRRIFLPLFKATSLPSELHNQIICTNVDWVPMEDVDDNVLHILNSSTFETTAVEMMEVHI